MARLLLNLSVLTDGSDISDFENNYKSTAIAVVQNIGILGSRTLTYSAFKTLINSDWANVHYRQEGSIYILFYITGAINTSVESSALPSGASTSANQYSQRPSEKSGRTHKDANLSNQTADATIYTVTTNKTFYLTEITMAAFNTSTGTVGIILIRDGAGGTVKIPFLMSGAGVGAVTAASALVATTIHLREPIPFSSGNAITADIISGTITYSVIINGYEETN